MEREGHALGHANRIASNSIDEIYPPADSLLNLDGYLNARYYYYFKSRPQYTDVTASGVISVKDHGAKGDGSHDDTAAIMSALALATTGNLIFFPAGSYIVTSTILIPPNARITGEVWSQIVASGSFFADMSNPKPMIQVGSPGDQGTVEISDMLFTSIGALPGLVVVEWNVKAASAGSGVSLLF